VPFQVANQLHDQLDQLAEESRSLRAQAQAEAARSSDLTAENQRLLEAATRVVPPAPPAPVHPTPEDPRVRRLAADLANVRRHTAESVQRARHEERANRISDLGEVYDDLLRSLASNAEPDSPYYQGNVAILQRIEGLFSRVEVTKIGVAGHPFNPNEHEAVGVAPGPEDQVIAVQQIGLSLPTGLVRPARVLVGSG